MTPGKSKKPSIPRLRVLFILIVALLGAITTLAAGPSINRWIIAPGGGYLDGAGINLQSAIGQPVAGSISNSFTLCSGFFCGPGATATTKSYVYLPALFNNYCNGFNGPGEKEPNNTQVTANGSLCFGQTYFGSPDNAYPGEEYDYFYIDLPAGSGVRITVTSFLADAQVILLEDATDTIVGRDFSQLSGNYQVNYDGHLGPGRYLVNLFAPANHPVGNGNYTLKVELY